MNIILYFFFDYCLEECYSTYSVYFGIYITSFRQKTPFFSDLYKSFLHLWRKETMTFKFSLGGKPTVEVHPMPSKQQNVPSGVDLRTSPDLITEKVREKPAVPKKPSKLLLSSRFESSTNKPAPLSLNINSLSVTPSSPQPNILTPQPGSLTSSPFPDLIKQPSPSTSRWLFAVVRITSSVI